MPKIRLRTVVLIILVALAGCPGKGPPASAPPPPTVTVAVPVQGQVQEYDEFTGRVAAIQSVEVRSRVGGYIESIGFHDGDNVRKGQVLYQIDPRPYRAELDEAKAALAQAEAQCSSAKRELARIEPLAATGTASPQELADAQDAVSAAEAAVAKAAATVQSKQLNLDYATVQSPIDGRASKTEYTLGNLVAGETLLTTVVSFDPINVNIDLDERRLLTYREMAAKRGHPNPERIRDANIRLEVALANEKDFPHHGIISFTDNQVDPGTGTIRLTGEFENADRALVPGQFIRARAPIGGPRQVLLIPDRAIGRDQDRKYVLVVNDKQIVEYRGIEVGGLFDGYRSIPRGLEPGERVIVDGVQRARPGKPVTPRPAPPPSPAPRQANAAAATNTSAIDR